MKRLQGGNREAGWTLDTLYAYFDAMMREQELRHRQILEAIDLRYQQRYDAQVKALDAAFLSAEKAVQTALTAAEKAVTKAETAAEKRFDAVNEFRGAYQDIIALQTPRAEFDSAMGNVRERLQELTDRVNRSEGRGAGLNAGWVYLLGAVAAIGTIISLYLAFNR